MSNCTLNRKSYFEYTNLPISPFRKLVFDKVIRKITHGDVADLGCGDAGIYWSLGYIERVQTVAMYDNSIESVNNLLESLETITPKLLENNHRDTLSYLKNKGLLKSMSQEVAEMLITKSSCIKKFDFLSSKSKQKYDFVLAIESLEVVNTEEDFVNAIIGARSFLKENGTLLGIIVRFEKVDDEIKSLAKLGLHGTLCPDEAMVRRSFEKAGFKNIVAETVEFPEMKNYPEGVLFYAK